MYSYKTNAIPDPGQRVKLLGRRGRRLTGRYRALSAPVTDPKDGVVIWVAEEHEYQEALHEGRRAEGLAWPVRQMEVVSEAPQAGAQAGEETARRPWWRRVFGG